MSNLVSHIEPINNEAKQSYLEAGIVVGRIGKAWLVEVGGRRVEAARAAMCLLEPRQGDEVLVTGLDARHFVLGVLTREDEKAADRISSDRELEIAAPRLQVIASEMQQHVGKLKVVAETVDTLCTRIIQRVKRSYRFVEETDQLRAGNIDQRAEQLVRTHGENTIITANKLAKIDGEQIHVG